METMIHVADARARLLAKLQPSQARSTPIASACGLALAHDIPSPISLPPFDNSAMDGYAVRAQDTAHATAEHPVSLHRTGTISAGQAPSTSPGPGECVRIFTGSAMPPGADAVVMQEDTETDASGEVIRIKEPARPWENVRFAGEDVKAGATLVRAGTVLNPAHLGLLAAAGLDAVPVVPAPRFFILSTGNELRKPGEPLRPGEIYESNSCALAALLEHAGGRFQGTAVAADNPQATRDALSRALEMADVVITAGGASVGDFDLVKPAIEALGGTIDFWRIAMKPGKPFFLAECHGKPVFGLPGNPVSAFVTALLLVWPAMAHLAGLPRIDPPSQPVRLAESITNPDRRTHFVRVCLDADGQARTAGIQASHILHSLAAADGLIEVPPQSRLEPGDVVKMIRWTPPLG